VSPFPLAFSALGRRVSSPAIARLMAQAVERPGILSLAAGFTDPGSLPREAVASAVRLRLAPDAPSEPLQYGTNQGRLELREILAARLARAEPGLDPARLAREMLVTNGSQQALYLAVQTLCDPGDLVLVEQPTYFVFLEMLAGLGVGALPIPVDAAGRPDPGALAGRLAEWRRTGEAGRIRALYLVSYYSNPSGLSLDAHRKVRLAEVLREAGLIVPVIEDAAYRELHFREPHPAPSVLTLPAWTAFPRLYAQTLTKPFATGLKLGYAVCDHEIWRLKMQHVKGHQDFGSSNFGQALLATALAGGDYDRQLERVRPIYERKRDALEAALAPLRALGWSWEQPAGGLYLWLEAPHGLATSMDSAFCRACLDAGVLYVPGDLCLPEPAADAWVRLSFGLLSVEALAEAGARFVAVARR
jgi:2-aminoadipate transaminase